ncbi:hypothetical protein Taro_034663 [Colocasia esculenta]|uniref:Secreted protein n=1 Tax=Colocasia esculenta TaxID=4460 RepID=A0A843VS19_COLES|nr:hypothetical protein [Colocasia esculenta]
MGLTFFLSLSPSFLHAFLSIQIRFYEELSPSGRPEEGKEVSLIISRTKRERDRGGRRDKRHVSHDDRVISCWGSNR